MFGDLTPEELQAEADRLEAMSRQAEQTAGTFRQLASAKNAVLALERQLAASTPPLAPESAASAHGADGHVQHQDLQCWSANPALAGFLGPFWMPQ